MNMDKDIEILEEFKENGFASLMIKYNKNRIQTNTMVKRAIENVLLELEKYKQYYEEQNEVNKVFVPKATFDIVNSELETYKKIAELFGKSLINISGEKTSLEELIDWAKSEVEKDEN